MVYNAIIYKLHTLRISNIYINIYSFIPDNLTLLESLRVCHILFQCGRACSLSFVIRDLFTEETFFKKINEIHPIGLIFPFIDLIFSDIKSRTPVGLRPCRFLPRFLFFFFQKLYVLYLEIPKTISLLIVTK